MTSGCTSRCPIIFPGCILNRIAILSGIKFGASPTLEYLVLRGSALARLGKWEEAGQSLTKALEMYPNQAGAYLNLGLYDLELGNKEKAMALIEKGAQLQSKGTKLLYSMASMEKCEGLVPPQEIKKQDTMRGELLSINLDGRCMIAARTGQRWPFICWRWRTIIKTAMLTLRIGRLCWEFDHH